MEKCRAVLLQHLVDFNQDALRVPNEVDCRYVYLVSISCGPCHAPAATREREKKLATERYFAESPQQHKSAHMQIKRSIRLKHEGQSSETTLGRPCAYRYRMTDVPDSLGQWFGAEPQACAACQPVSTGADGILDTAGERAGPCRFALLKSNAVWTP